YMVIRFRHADECGRERFRTIHVGRDPELIRRADELLRTWQSERHPGRSPNPATRQAWELVMSQARWMNRGARRAFVKHHRAAASSPVQLLLAMQSWRSIMRERRARSRGGRPRKARLVT